MSEGNTVLTHFFSQSMLNSFIAERGPSVELMHRIVRKYCIPTDEETTNEKVISDIYHYVGKSYRNEYFYKNTLLNKLIINVHRINTTTALTEVPIAKSKADFIMINGKAVVYEIKTELDSFDRLLPQISDYYKAFDHVCVVTSEQQLKSLQEIIADSPVGIYVLTSRNTIRRVKEPITYRENLDANYIFKILNKPEYESIVLKVNGVLPDVTPVKHYQACRELLCNIPLAQFYDLFLLELKKRNKICITDYTSVPSALNFLLYFSKEGRKNICKLQDFLSAPFERG